MKKRYHVTLTEETVDRFHSLTAQMKLPKSTMSSMLDDALSVAVINLEKWTSQGKVTMLDLFSLIGSQLDTLCEEVNPDDKEAADASQKKEGKRKTVRR